jgi:hypothetical protein
MVDAGALDTDILCQLSEGQAAIAAARAARRWSRLYQPHWRGPTAEIGVHLVQPRKMSPDPLQRGKRFVPQVRAPRIVSPIALDDFGAERLFAAKWL